MALVVNFALMPLLPGLAPFATALAVISTAVLAWFLRDRQATPDLGDDGADAVNRREPDAAAETVSGPTY